jgi:hypothetical protein
VSDDTFRAGRWRRYPFGHPPVRRDKLMSDRERVSDERLRAIAETHATADVVLSLAAELLDARDRIARAGAVLEVSPWHSTTTFCTVCHARAILTGDNQ